MTEFSADNELEMLKKIFLILDTLGFLEFERGFDRCGCAAPWHVAMPQLQH